MKSKNPTIDTKTVSHIAKLANVTIAADKLEEATTQFGSVLGYVSNIQKVDTSTVKDENNSGKSSKMWREDVVDSSRTLSQAEALSNAPSSHNGYFVVDSILSE
jgi:aspartyl-tRNA(Asn)/glutamyl-tRNA(Gln) amidotransferase subunit C